MNNFRAASKKWHATESKPALVMWLAAGIFGGYAVLGWQDAQVEQAIQAAAQK